MVTNQITTPTTSPAHASGFLLLVPETAHGELRQPQKVQKPCTGGYMVATRAENKKARYRFDSAFSLCSLVGPEGFEPSTNGLRVRCSTN